MRKLFPACAAVLVVLLGLTAGVKIQAAPAPWYWWISQLDGQRVCAQFSPGHGWARGSGPFRDAHCKQLAPRR